MLYFSILAIILSGAYVVIPTLRSGSDPFILRLPEQMKTKMLQMQHLTYFSPSPNVNKLTTAMS